MSVQHRGALAPLHLEHHRRATATALRGCRCARAAPVHLTPDQLAAQERAAHASSTRTCTSRRRRGLHPDGRVRPRAAALVRAVRRATGAMPRRSTSTCTSGRCRYEIYFLPTRRRTTSTSTGSCSSATTRCTARASRSGRTATCT
jgi:hypothetical protein